MTFARLCVQRNTKMKIIQVNIPHNKYYNEERAITGENIAKSAELKTTYCSHSRRTCYPLSHAEPR